MKKTIDLRTLRSVFLLSPVAAAVLFAGGCNKSAAPAAAPTTAAAPADASQPNSGSAMSAAAPAPAPSAAPAPAPAASTATAAPAPAAQPAPPPPPPAPVTYTVPANTRIHFRISQTLSAKDNNVGDSFSGVLTNALVVKGVTVVKAGAPVRGTVSAAKRQGRFKGTGDLGIEVTAIGPHTVRTTEYEEVQKGKGKRTAGFIGGGAGLGAIIGGIAGGGKGAAIGALAGGGAGTAGAAYTGNKNVVIPAESVLSVSLLTPISVQK